MSSSKQTMTAAQIEDLARRNLEGWNAHDPVALAALMTEDVRWTEPVRGAVQGRAAATLVLEDTFTAFPDFHIAPEEFHVFPKVEDSTCVTVWTLTATMTGPLEMGIPATGKPVRISGAAFTRMRDGLVCEYANYYDALDFMQQLGLLPRTEGLAFKALVTADVLAGKARTALHV